MQYDLAYGDFKDSARRSVSDKKLRDKTFNDVNSPELVVLPQCFLNSLIGNLLLQLVHA